MVSKETIRNVKQSTVAVGLVERDNPKPLVIYGSGFIIDDNGVIATAEHVLEACRTARKFHKNRGIETDYAIFRPIHSESEFNFDVAVIGDLKNITNVERSNNFPLNVIDLGFGKMFSPIEDCKPLEIDSDAPNIFDDIAMCGFPSGDFTLDMEGQRMGIRYSPLFQFGKISGLLPFDDAKSPYGIQTDIIGVGGSSGSPIINPKNSKIIGIAQQVIPADVEVRIPNTKLNEELSAFGMAKIGQVYGISNSTLRPIIEAIKNYYRYGTLKDVKIHASGLDFTSHFKTEVTLDKSKLE